jgi:hypothetical protein
MMHAIRPPTEAPTMSNRAEFAAELAVVGAEVEVRVRLGVEVNGLPVGLKLVVNGVRLGVEVGSRLGVEVGARLGVEVGARLGVEVGARLGVVVGARLGVEVGARLGVEVGARLGLKVAHVALETPLMQALAGPQVVGKGHSSTSVKSHAEG